MAAADESFTELTDIEMRVYQEMFEQEAKMFEQEQQQPVDVAASAGYWQHVAKPKWPMMSQFNSSQHSSSQGRLNYIRSSED